MFYTKLVNLTDNKRRFINNLLEQIEKEAIQKGERQ